MATVDPIDLPTLPDEYDDHRSLIENHVYSLLDDFSNGRIRIQKYYKTANEQIYQDCLNRIQSGVPNWMVRTTKVETNEYNPGEKADDCTARTQIIHAVPVAIEKNIYDVDRYIYTMEVLVRELLRRNPIKTIPRNRRRPFIYLNSRDIFRDDQIDIVISEFNVEYIEV